MKRVGIVGGVLVLLCVALYWYSQKRELYAEPLYWYDNGKSVDPRKVDVFYILPTCVFDWSDSSGQVSHYASLTDSAQRAAMLPSYQLADDIFADSANFFAPYYRHISLNTWMEGEEAVEERFPAAMADIREAFGYYMKHKNGGRPFLLAGFSQGAKCVVELVKELTPEQASRMVAAYVCGYKVTPADTCRAPFLRAAKRADDTGVTIVYNTVGKAEATAPILTLDNMWVINPASWTTDTMAHALNDSVSIQVDESHKVLIAKGLDEDAVFVESLQSLFPVGNYHLLELTLYHDLLQKNVKQRIRSYGESAKSVNR